MYYQSYEDYMRAVLGYPLENTNTYELNYIEDRTNTIVPYQNTKELEECYPDIYKAINPIICDICDKFTNYTITKELVDKMVDEVYTKIEMDNEIAIRINIDNRSTEKEVENRTNINNTKSNSRILNNEVRKNIETDKRQIRPNNPFLRDLIKILILNRILGGVFPGRPPVRPPFPGPGGGIPRPPRLRDYDDYLKF